MLKLSITQGPYVGDSNQGFVISVDHCQELSNFLFEWYKTLPELVTKHIEAIIVGPYNCSAGQRVSIRIICSGGGKIPWKKNAELKFFHFSTREKILYDHPKLGLQLNWELWSALKDEKESHETVTSRLADLTGMMEKTERSFM